LNRKKNFEMNSNWTSVSEKHAHKHYRICGKKFEEEYVLYEMMAVLDKKDRFWILEKELGNQKDWLLGWKD